MTEAVAGAGMRRTLRPVARPLKRALWRARVERDVRRARARNADLAVFHEFAPSPAGGGHQTPPMEAELMMDGEAEPVGPVIEGEGDQDQEVELRQGVVHEVVDPGVREGASRQPSCSVRDPEDRHVDR